MTGQEAIDALLRERAPGTTICPSEAARLLAKARSDEDWRGYMDEVHGCVDRMLASRRVMLSWKGIPMAARDGPYRIARPRR